MSGLYEAIGVDRHGGVVTVTLSRPKMRNHVGPQLLGELLHALEDAKKNRRCKVVVLTGSGEVFSAGGDLSTTSGEVVKTGKIEHASLVNLFSAMHKLGKPIIARVNGHALAGGLGIMVACDLVIASNTATFGTTEIQLGLWPMMISAELTRNIGRKKTLEMMLTGKCIDATEAERIGLINQSVPPEALAAVTLKLAESIAAQSPSTMAHGLRSFYEVQDLSYESTLENLENKLSVLLQTKDACEGLVAFLQKRKPKWTDQ